MQKIFFDHQPRCGGTTTTWGVLAPVLGFHKFLIAGSDFQKIGELVDTSSARNLKEYPGVSSHNLSEFRPFMPEGLWITQLRNPLDQWKSMTLYRNDKFHPNHPPAGISEKYARVLMKVVEGFYDLVDIVPDGSSPTGALNEKLFAAGSFPLIVGAARHRPTGEVRALPDSWQDEWHYYLERLQSLLGPPLLDLWGQAKSRYSVPPQPSLLLAQEATRGLEGSGETASALLQPPSNSEQIAQVRNASAGHYKGYATQGQVIASLDIPIVRLDRRNPRYYLGINSHVAEGTISLQVNRGTGLSDFRVGFLRRKLSRALQKNSLPLTRRDLRISSAIPRFSMPPLGSNQYYGVVVFPEFPFYSVDIIASTDGRYDFEIADYVTLHS
jgi:hypothetical protein